MKIEGRYNIPRRDGLDDGFYKRAKKIHSLFWLCFTVIVQFLLSIYFTSNIAAKPLGIRLEDKPCRVWLAQPPSLYRFHKGSPSTTKRSFSMKKMNASETGIDFEIKLISLNSIEIHGNHIRKFTGDLSSLKSSMKAEGMIEPPKVYEIAPEKYGLIDGSRRIKVLTEMGVTEISAIVIRGIDEANASHLSYVFNNERKTLTPIEKAEHIERMRSVFNFTFDELEIKGYGSPGTIKNLLKLLELPNSIQKMVDKEKITIGHALAISKLKSDGDKERLAKKIIDHEMTVRATEERITRLLSKERKRDKEACQLIVPSTEIPGIYFKDNCEMREIPDKQVHLIVTSPPYNFDMEYERGVDFKEHSANMRAAMSECARVLCPGGIMALNIADINNFKHGANGYGKFGILKPMVHLYQSWLNHRGVILNDIFIWRKQVGWNKHPQFRFTADTVHTEYRPFNNWEYVCIFRKKGERVIEDAKIAEQSLLTQEQWMAYIDGVWDIRTVRDNGGHPCPFPDELVRRLVCLYSYLGDTVLDPHLGTGTTIKVAREEGRRGIGYEKELKYKPIIMSKLGISDEKQPEPETHDDFSKNIGVITQPDEESSDDSEKSGIERAAAALFA